MIEPVPAASRERRKALLEAKAELERAELALLAHDLRRTIAPPRPRRPKGARAMPLAAAIVGIGLPLFGRRRLSRLLRAGSLALTAWRFARNWQRTPPR